MQLDLASDDCYLRQVNVAIKARRALVTTGRSPGHVGLLYVCNLVRASYYEAELVVLPKLVSLVTGQLVKDVCFCLTEHAWAFTCVQMDLKNLF